LMCYLWTHLPLGSDLGGVTLLRRGDAVPSHGLVSVRGAEITIGLRTLRGSVLIVDDDNQWMTLGVADRESVILIVADKLHASKRSLPSGGEVDCIRLPLTQELERRYRDLTVSGSDYLCPDMLGAMEPTSLASIKTRLLIERLSDKCAHLNHIRRLSGGGDCDMAVAALFDTIMISNAENRRLFGELSTIIGHNRIVSSLVSGDKEADKVAVEALLLGAAGFLSEASVHQADDYVYRLRAIFERLRKGYRLTPISYERWRRASYRDTSPALMIAQTAAILADIKPLYFRICECDTLESLRKLFDESPSEYWRNHYALGKQCEEVSTGHRITKDKSDRLLINFILPFMFDRMKNDCPEDEDKASTVVEMFDQIDGERNSITGKYDTRIEVNSAFDSQALIQLDKRYCRERRCWQCPVGIRYLARRQNTV
ncbi:MAG: DUF2851 family protein, partial [Rikenellaceae bacterium]|nr:DUF2851 family protein [Rikenellaceae bacterium]